MNDLPFPEEDGRVVIPFSLVKGSQITKALINEGAETAMEKIMEEGMEDPTLVYAKLKAISEFVSACMQKIKGEALTEIDKYGKEGNSVLGINLQATTSATAYTYDHNLEWCELDAEKKVIVDKQKAVEKKMKSAVGTAGFIDKEGGEPLAPAKYKSGGAATIKASIPAK